MNAEFRTFHTNSANIVLLPSIDHHASLRWALISIHQSNIVLHAMYKVCVGKFVLSFRPDSLSKRLATEWTGPTHEHICRRGFVSH